MATYWEQHGIHGIPEIYRLHEEGEVLARGMPQQEGLPVFWFDGVWKWALYNISDPQIMPANITTHREREAWVIAQWRMA